MSPPLVREGGKAAAGDQRASSRRELGGLLLVALSPPLFDVGSENHASLRGLQIAITDFAFEIQESFCLLASRLISFSLTRFNSY